MPSLRDSLLFHTRTPDLRPGLMNAAAPRLQFCGFIPPLQPEFGSHALTEAHPKVEPGKSRRKAAERMSVPKTAQGVVAHSLCDSLVKLIYGLGTVLKVVLQDLGSQCGVNGRCFR